MLPYMAYMDPMGNSKPVENPHHRCPRPNLRQGTAIPGAIRHAVAVGVAGSGHGLFHHHGEVAAAAEGWAQLLPDQLLGQGTIRHHGLGGFEGVAALFLGAVETVGS